MPFVRTWFVPLPVCDYSQGVDFPPRRRSIFFRGSFQQTNKQTWDTHYQLSIKTLLSNKHPLLKTTLSKVYCGSAFEPGASGLPYYCTPPVCVPDEIGALALWRLQTKQNKKVQWYWGVPWKPCNFSGSRLAKFLMGSKDAPQKMQFLGAINKVAGLDPWHQNAKLCKTSSESTVTGPKYV